MNDRHRLAETRFRRLPPAAGAATALAGVAARLDARAEGGRRFAIRFWDGSELLVPGGGEPEAVLVVRSPRALAYVLREPNELGLGRAWVAGDLDLEGDLHRALATAASLRSRPPGASVRSACARRRRRPGKRASPAGAIRSGATARPSGTTTTSRTSSTGTSSGRHWIYSYAYFDSPEEGLDAAQERKLDLICRKLRLGPKDRLLDVGCGWGSLVLHAAERYGTRAVGITLSEPQAELARERIGAAGLTGRCEVRVADYREVRDGPYDKVASVGMVEHVGAGKLGEYAESLRRLLRPGGLLLNHGITRASPRPWGGKSFVARFVFPDGELESVSMVIGALEGAGLEVRDVESLREHYALTLRRWLANLAAAREQAIAEAGPERERIWRLYMTGAVHAFERGDISVYQVLAAVPDAPRCAPGRSR